MSISVFDLFSIGVGPSSSHTVGPMRAAYDFIQTIDIEHVHRIQVTLYGSLAHTGQGHMTHHALLMGLSGELPHLIEPANINQRVEQILVENKLVLSPDHAIEFEFNRDIVFNKTDLLPKHSNGMQFFAWDANNQLLEKEIYYSVGGGFIEQEHPSHAEHVNLPYDFESAETLLQTCRQHKLRIDEIMLANELMFNDRDTIKQRLRDIEHTMMQCIELGCQESTTLPGSLQLNRRAADIWKKVLSQGEPRQGHPQPMNCLNAFAVAASEQNACGGRIVTAPTNGAAGIIPAVIRYHRAFDSNASDESVDRFLLTAGAICLLYKKNASISGAEMGCQGEVGVACSIAAAGLAAARGGTLNQIENAAEIGIEHNLGLTCDPVAGLVQIPCIERNAMGAVKAVNACSLALISNDPGRVTLDMAIDTMREIGNDMKAVYKETSLGGLAVNVPSC